MLEPHECAVPAHPVRSLPAGQLVVQRAPADAEQPRGLGFVALRGGQRALDLRKGQRTQAPGVCFPGAIEILSPVCHPGSCQLGPHRGPRDGAGVLAGLLLAPALWLVRRRLRRGARSLAALGLFGIFALGACSSGSTSAPDDGGTAMELGGAGGGVDYAPYFYTWGFGSPSYAFKSLAEMKQKSGLSAATLAFVLGNSAGSPACSVTTDGTTNVIETLMKDDIAAFRAAGGRLKVSFGGANGLNLDDDRACPSAMALFTAPTAFRAIRREGALLPGRLVVQFDHHAIGIAHEDLPEIAARNLPGFERHPPGLQARPHA